MKFDSEQLTHVPDCFASTTDMLLCVGPVHFPVHACILSGQSEILQNAIADLKPRGVGDQAAELILPLSGDDPATVQAALACVYTPFYESSLRLESPGLQPDLLLWVMRFAHKYNMDLLFENTGSALTAMFARSRRTELQTLSSTVPLDLEFTAEVILAALTCGQNWLLAYSESYLVQHFDRLSDDDAAPLLDPTYFPTWMRVVKGSRYHTGSSSSKIQHEVELYDACDKRTNVTSVIIDCPGRNGACEVTIMTFMLDPNVTTDCQAGDHGKGWCNNKRCAWPSHLQELAECMRLLFFMHKLQSS